MRTATSIKDSNMYFPYNSSNGGLLLPFGDTDVFDGEAALMEPKLEYLEDLDRAEEWYKDDIRSVGVSLDRDRQLRYSLCNKLNSDWQKFAKASCIKVGVDTKGLGNCWPDTITNAYNRKSLPDPFAGIAKTDLAVFEGLERARQDSMIKVRNAIDHGDEPDPSNNIVLERWIRDLRKIAKKVGF